MKKDVPGLDALLRQCIHCGMCLTACPTYSVFGTEMDNPRGRIALLSGVSKGRIEPADAFAQHIGRCLGCMACVAVCPSGVKYGQLLERAHTIALVAHQRGRLERFIRWLGMRQLMPHVGRLRLLALLVTLYQATGLQRLVRRLNLLPRGLQAGEALLPARPFRPRTRPSAGLSSGARNGRVGLFIGCMQEAFLGDVNQATVRVLERNGYEVVIPQGQTCCGALHKHEGEERQTVELAKKNIDAFLRADVEAIIVNAGGCGPVLTAYPELLHDDPHYAERAQVFGSRLHDVGEFLVEKGVEAPRGRLAVRATYSDSCHLRNEQGVIHQPRELIRSIPGLELVELQRPERCCGSAGIYNIVHPEIADQVLDAKLADIAVHLVQLLDEAYAAEAKEGSC
jgi:glycolate oxidase iron-sulfur subunit